MVYDLMMYTFIENQADVKVEIEKMFGV